MKNLILAILLTSCTCNSYLGNSFKEDVSKQRECIKAESYLTKYRYVLGIRIKFKYIVARSVGQGNVFYVPYIGAPPANIGDINCDEHWTRY